MRSSITWKDVAEDPHPLAGPQRDPQRRGSVVERAAVDRRDPIERGDPIDQQMRRLTVPTGVHDRLEQGTAMHRD